MKHENGLVTNSIWANAAGTNTLWTPATGKRVRMTRLYLHATANATLGNQGGILTLTLMLGGVSTDMAWKLYVPPQNVLSSYPAAMQTWNVNYQIGTAGTPAITGGINVPLQLNLDKGLTAGLIGAQIMGWEDE